MYPKDSKGVTLNVPQRLYMSSFNNQREKSFKANFIGAEAAVFIKQVPLIVTPGKIRGHNDGET